MFTISHIRAQARQTINTTPGVFLLSLIPVGISLFMNLLNFTNRRNLDITTIANHQGRLAQYFIGSVGFPLFYELLVSLLYLSIALTIYQVITRAKEATTAGDALAIFNSPHFGKIFVTFLVKQVFLFLWGLIATVGLLFLLGSFILIVAYALASGSVEVIPDEILTLFGTFFILGLVITIAGVALYLPQVYAYSQTEFILFEQLENNQYAGVRAIIKESRQLMKGYKWKRFVLDVTFIGWFILIGLSFGLVGIYVQPYYAAAQVHFYQAVKTENGLRLKAYFDSLKGTTDSAIQSN